MIMVVETVIKFQRQRKLNMPSKSKLNATVRISEICLSIFVTQHDLSDIVKAMCSDLEVTKHPV